MNHTAGDVVYFLKGARGRTGLGHEGQVHTKTLTRPDEVIYALPSLSHRFSNNIGSITQAVSEVVCVADTPLPIAMMAMQRFSETKHAEGIPLVIHIHIFDRKAALLATTSSEWLQIDSHVRTKRGGIREDGVMTSLIASGTSVGLCSKVVDMMTRGHEDAAYTTSSTGMSWVSQVLLWKPFLH